MLKVAIAGINGRMGHALASALFAEDSEIIQLSAAFARSGSGSIGRDVGELYGQDANNVIISSDYDSAEFNLMIDFTQVVSTLSHLAYCREHGIAMVIGTTGFDAAQKQVIVDAAAQIPIVLAPNMSVGVNLCLHLLQQAAAVVGQQADIEIIETHHRDKLDAPSGTALAMGEVIAAELNQDLATTAVYGRQGLGEVRDQQAIGFSSIRAGDVVGDHTVLFATAGERIELTHKATSRQTFASGAVRAALWLAKQPPGLYDMRDVLGLQSK